MKYDQSLIDKYLVEADRLMNQGKMDRSQVYYIRAIAMMLRNAQEPIVNNIKTY